jgi:hypothetical protein
MNYEIPDEDLEQLHTYCGQARFDTYGNENKLPEDVVKNYHRYRHIHNRGSFSPLTPDAFAYIVFASTLTVGPKTAQQDTPKNGDTVYAKWRGKEIEAKFLAPCADPEEWLVDLAGEERRLAKKLIRVK